MFYHILSIALPLFFLASHLMISSHFDVLSGQSVNLAVCGMENSRNGLWTCTFLLVIGCSQVYSMTPLIPSIFPFFHVSTSSTRCTHRIYYCRTNRFRNSAVPYLLRYAGNKQNVMQELRSKLQVWSIFHLLSYSHSWQCWKFVLEMNKALSCLVLSWVEGFTKVQIKDLDLVSVV